uniref:Uncharacterized protein n=1 Tax=Timema bartmani TaxID=61472 RepID=A0A7R9EXW6_9NEOP|nr:unnamed protein product [Timema bartmani]
MATHQPSSSAFTSQTSRQAVSESLVAQNMGLSTLHSTAKYNLLGGNRDKSDSGSRQEMKQDDQG